MLHTVLPKTQNIKISSGHSLTTVHCQNIDCMHQIGPRNASRSILLSRLMFTMCQCRSLCENGSCLSSNMEWKSINTVAEISCCLSKCYVL